MRDAAHPETRYRIMLRQSAKRRRIEFALPLPCFRLWCAIHGMPRAGMSVDRIHEHVGYLIGNLQPLPHGDNTRKSWMDFHEAGEAGLIKGYISQPF